MSIHQRRSTARTTMLSLSEFGLPAADAIGSTAEAPCANATETRPKRIWALTDPVACTILVAIDAITLFLGSMASWFIYHVFFGTQLSSWRFYVVTSALLATVCILNGLRSSVYGFLWGVERQESVIKILRGYIQAFLLFVTALVLLQLADHYSRVTLILQFFVCGASLLALRSVQFKLLHRPDVAAKCVSSRVILVGLEDKIADISKCLHQQAENVQVLKTYPLWPIAASGPVTLARIDEVADRIVSASRELRPDRIVVLLPIEQRQQINRLIQRFAELPVSILVSTEQLVTMHGKPAMLSFGGRRMVRVVRRPLSATDRIIKRAFDLAVSAIAGVILLPAIAAAALAVKLDSPGPVFFRQERKGFNQERFSILKLRTMQVAEEGEGFQQTSRTDARVTGIGKLLRRWNIDELPQLINVMKGEMSLVGPRPHAVEHDEMYYTEISAYARRHNVKPGITGLAQVMGFRGATETLEQMEDRVTHDLAYIQNWSLLLDLKILLMTVFSPRAYRNAF